MLASKIADPLAADDTVEQKADRVINASVPSGGFLQNYGGHLGVGAVLVAAFEFLGKDTTGEASKLLSQPGLRWLFYSVLGFFIWDLAKRLLRLFGLLVGFSGRFVAHVGDLATNAGRGADAIGAFAGRAEAISAQQAQTSGQMADAMTRLASQADNKDRQLDEVVTVVGVIAKQMERVSDRMDLQDKSLVRIEDRLGVNGQGAQQKNAGDAA